uniref:RUS family member 1 n=1 Tax=Centroberyx gerrardi TaxID=166262 RepID=UPI003AB06119
MEKDTSLVLATEKYGSGESWRYLVKDGAMERKRDGSEGGTRGNSVIGVFKSVFLPQGYPESVSDDYLQYQFWDTVQAFSSSLSGTLATQASLKGVGVGNQEATVAAATVTWLLRDGTGMLGRILFAWRKGTKLDSEAKKWRLFADVLNDIAMFMEILAPNFPACFTLIVCTAGIFKSIVGVAGGATRAALTVHQARRDNMADISAKDGSQETLVNLAGLLISLVLIPLVTDNPLLTLSLFFLFTILHLYANYKAVRSVVMETFNEARLSIVLHQYLRDGRILSPVEANQREPVFLEFRKTVPIKLGVRLKEVVQSPEELNLALKNNNMPFLLGVKNGCVCVCLGPEASVGDEIRAVCQAVCLSSALHPETPLTGASQQPLIQKRQSHWEMVCDSHKLMDQIFNPFLKGVEAAGWQINRTLLDWDEWRVEWKAKSS